MSQQQTSIQFAGPPKDQDVEEISIRVIGVGGGGGNAINSMVRSKLSRVRFIAANTDQQALEASKADEILPLGVGLTRGLGAGARPTVGRESALESREAIAAQLIDADIVFVTAGMGGGTGTGAAPVIAEVAREQGALCVAVVTRPFSFEGKKRRRVAEAGIEALREVVDTLIVIPNDRLVALAGDDMSTMDAFTLADQILLDAVRGIVELIHVKGVVNADFADVRTVMSISGMTLMGLGKATGEMRAVEAAQRAISSPLLEEAAMTGAKGVLVNVTSNASLKLAELTEAVALIEEEAHEDAEVIFGWVVDEGLDDEVRITVIATGIDSDALLEEQSPAGQAEPQLDRLLRTNTVSQRAVPVSPWAMVSGEGLDLPPTVRQERSSLASPIDRSVLERSSSDVFQRQLDDDMAHLDRPTFVRKLAD